MCTRFVGLVVAMAAAAHGQIAVETQGTAVVKPDVAYVGLVVSQRGLELPKLAKDVQARAGQIADKLSKLQGVRKCHVRPPEVSVEEPSRAFDGTAPAPKIFRAHCPMLIEASPEQDLVYKLLAAAVESGAEFHDVLPAAFGFGYDVYGTDVVYGVTDADEAYARAFGDALKRASLMAERLAAQAGLKLGAVKTVEHQGDRSRGCEYPPPTSRFAGAQVVGTDPEKFEIVVRVKITFETK